MNFENISNDNKRYKHDSEALTKFSELLSNIHLLKNKEYGCPWQNNQTHESLLKYLLEESFEFIGSVKNKDLENMKEELGDILLQILLHTEIGYEENEFSISEVIDTLNKKIKSRNPYIFKKIKKVSLAESSIIWNKEKNNNKKNHSKSLSSDKLFKVLDYLDPIKTVEEINKLLENYKITWKDHLQIIEKLNEEIIEIEEAIQNKNKLNIEEEFGDIYFSLINLSIKLDINPNDSLIAANKKFLKRFSIIEKILNDRMEDKSEFDFKILWKAAKDSLNQEKLI